MIVVFPVILLVVPAFVAALLRLAGLNRGSSIVGGILAGLTLGPTVAGRVWPAQFNEVLRGDHPAWSVRNGILIRQRGELIIAERDGLTPPELLQVRERHDRELVVIDLHIHDADWNHQRELRLFVMLITAIVLASSGTKPSPRPTQPQNWIHAASTGFSAAVMPGALAFVACRFCWELGVDESLMVAAALSIGPWMLNSADRRAADDAEIGGARMVQTAGRVASVTAIILALAALLVRFGQRELWMGASLLVMPVGWLALRSCTGRGVAILLPAACKRVFIPCLAATGMLHIDLLEHARLWPIVVVLILSGDGRWLGAFVGALSLGGRKALRTMRLVMGSMSAGPTQLAVATVGLWMGLISPQLALPILLGAALIEISATWRHGMASRIIQLEHDLEEARRSEDNLDDRP